MSSEIVKHEGGTGQLMRQATDVAGVCRDIVMKTAMELQGRKYVKVEGWQSIAVAYGCVASARDVELVPGGVRAIGEVRRMSDGAVVATAEGFVGEDEPVWYGGGINKRTGKPHEKRPLYAIRAMAQTRAVSRACRSAFAFVVTLIDSNLSTTPAEEVPDGGFLDAVATPVTQRQDDLKAKLAASVAVVNAAAKASPPRQLRTEDGSTRPMRVSAGPSNFPNYGKAKGAPIHGASMRDLEFYANGCRKSLNDPAKANWHAKEQALLEVIQDEMARQSGPQDDGPPPPTDADAPPEAF